MITAVYKIFFDTEISVPTLAFEGSAAEWTKIGLTTSITDLRISGGSDTVTIARTNCTTATNGSFSGVMDSAAILGPATITFGAITPTATGGFGMSANGALGGVAAFGVGCWNITNVQATAATVEQSASLTVNATIDLGELQPLDDLATSYLSSSEIQSNSFTLGTPFLMPSDAELGLYQVFFDGAGGQISLHSADVFTVLPAHPSSLAATTPGGSVAQLTWTDNSGTDPSFVITYANNSLFTGSTDTTALAGATTKTISGLSPGTWYFKVKATEDGLDSSYSNTASVTLVSRKRATARPYISAAKSRIT